MSNIASHLRPCAKNQEFRVVGNKYLCPYEYFSALLETLKCVKLGHILPKSFSPLIVQEIFFDGKIKKHEKNCKKVMGLIKISVLLIVFGCSSVCPLDFMKMEIT